MTDSEIEDVLAELVQLIRGRYKTDGRWLEAKLGTEPDDFGFIEITLTHGLTKRLMAAQEAPK